MFKLPNNCTHLTKQQSNVQKSPSQASIREPGTSRCSSWIQKSRGIRDQIANIHWIIKKAREFLKNISFIDYTKAFDCVDHNKLWKILKEMGIPGHLTCLEKSVCRSRSTSQNWTWNNRLVPNRKRSTSRLYIVTLLIVHHEKCWTG